MVGGFCKHVGAVTLRVESQRLETDWWPMWPERANVWQLEAWQFSNAPGCVQVQSLKRAGRQNEHSARCSSKEQMRWSSGALGAS